MGCAVEVEEAAVASRPVMPVGRSSIRSSPLQKRFGVAGLVAPVEVEPTWVKGADGLVRVEVGDGRNVERMWWWLCKVDERGEP